jgi:hypothetical protein
MSKPSPISYLINGLKGLFIGVANAIPGVSGGTIAVITGIYEPLIAAFGAVGDGIASIFTKDRRWREKITSALPILIPVVLGLAVGLVGFANVIETLSERFPMQTQFLFIGLILGSLPYLIKQTGKTEFRWTYLIPLVLGTGSPGLDGDHQFPDGKPGQPDRRPGSYPDCDSDERADSDFRRDDRRGHHGDSRCKRFFPDAAHRHVRHLH